MLLGLLATRPIGVQAQVEVTVDIAAIANEIKEIVFHVLNNATEEKKEQLKNSVAQLSKDLSDLAEAKRSLVKFLDHQPAYISDFNSLAKSTAEKQLKQIDGQIGGLQKDLHAIDPNWAAENLELYQSLNAVILGKGLEF